MTASQLILGLKSAGVNIATTPAGLAIFGEIPNALDPVLSVLHTGVRAILTSKRWVGYSSANGRPCFLHFDQLLPHGVNRLIVEGDAAWDCIPAAEVIEHPQLWAAPVNKSKRAT